MEKLNFREQIQYLYTKNIFFVFLGILILLINILFINAYVKSYQEHMIHHSYYIESTLKTTLRNTFRYVLSTKEQHINELSAYVYRYNLYHQTLKKEGTKNIKRYSYIIKKIQEKVNDIYKKSLVLQSVFFITNSCDLIGYSSQKQSIIMYNTYQHVQDSICNKKLDKNNITFITSYLRKEQLARIVIPINKSNIYIILYINIGVKIKKILQSYNIYNYTLQEYKQHNITNSKLDIINISDLKHTIKLGLTYIKYTKKIKLYTYSPIYYILTYNIQGPIKSALFYSVGTGIILLILLTLMSYINYKQEQRGIVLKQNEIIYKQSLKLYQLNHAINAISIGIIMNDDSGNILYCNDAILDIFSFSSKKDILEKSIHDFSKEFQICPLEIDNINEWANFSREIYYTKNSKYIKLLTEIIYFDNGNFGLITVCEDITEKKKQEQTLIQLQHAIDTTEIGITITDVNNYIVYMNEADIKMHGYQSFNELAGKHSSVLAPSHKRKRTTELHTEYWERESINVTKSGTTFPVRIVSNTIINTDNRILGKVSVCQDITKQKEIEQKLRESEARFRTLFKKSPVSLLEVNLAETKKLFKKTLDKYTLLSEMKQYYKNNYNEYKQLIKSVKICFLNNKTLEIFKIKKQNQFKRLFSLYTLQDKHYTIIDSLYMLHTNQSASYETKINKNKNTCYIQYIVRVDQDYINWEKVFVSIIDITDYKLLLIEHEQLMDDYRTLATYSNTFLQGINSKYE